MALLPDFPLFIYAGFSFSSDYLYNNVHTTMEEKIMRDPLARIANSIKDRQYLHEKYPILFPHLPDSKGSPGIGIAVVTMPMLFGSQVRFTPHMDPIALPIMKTDEDPMQLRKPNLDDAMQWLYSEIDTLVEHGYRKGSIGMPNMQGPLNIAFRIIGDTKMLGLLARPSKAAVVSHIMEVVSDTFIEATQRLHKTLGHPEKNSFSMAGCTYYYLSPTQWMKYELPIVKKCQVLGPISLHHCGVATHDMLDNYVQIPWNHVEFGFGTDLKYARQKFISPKLGPLPFSCRVSPYRLLNESKIQIEKDVNWIIENIKGGPTSISCVGIPWQTPDENIYAMYNTIQRYNQSKADEDETDGQTNESSMGSENN
jgi:uroporphyrinogen-III decarboxylase